MSVKAEPCSCCNCSAVASARSDRSVRSLDANMCLIRVTTASSLQEALLSRPHPPPRPSPRLTDACRNGSTQCRLSPHGQAEGGDDIAVATAVVVVGAIVEHARLRL